MSRHFFKCELRCEVQVVLGYEEAAQGYFLEVTRVGANPGHGYSPFIYRSTDDSYNTGDDLEYCRERIEKLGLVVPESMYRAVEEDAAHSNRCVEHYSDGRAIER
jgi:hypothetical protein